MALQGFVALSEPLEKPAEHARVAVRGINKSKSRAEMIRWKNLSERKCACRCAYMWLSIMAPWTRPREMTNVQNNEE